MIMRYATFATSTAKSNCAFQYTQLVWGLLFGVLLFEDFPDTIALGGAVLVVGSAFYVGMTQSPSAADDLAEA
jgi:S-adenosylmethionine uptake transporter